MKFYITILLLCLYAGAAQASQWNLRGDTAEPTDGIRPGQWATAIIDANSDDSNLLNVVSCKEVDVFWFYDDDADGTADTTPIVPRNCSQTRTTGAANACPAVLGVTLQNTGTTSIQAAGISKLFLDVGAGTHDTAPAAVDHVLAVCHGPGGSNH